MPQPVVIPDDPQGDPAPENKPAPESEPLGEGGIKALNAERDARTAAEKHATELQRQLAEANQQLTAVRNDGLPEWQQKFNELKAQLDGEVTARKQAEDDAANARLVQLRTSRASETDGFPKSLVKKLTGQTAEEIDEEIAEIMTDLQARSTPAGRVPTEGRTVTSGSGNPAQQFASLISNQLRNS